MPKVSTFTQIGTLSPTDLVPVVRKLGTSSYKQAVIAAAKLENATASASGVTVIPNVRNPYVAVGNGGPYYTYDYTGTADSSITLISAAGSLTPEMTFIVTTASSGTVSLTSSGGLGLGIPYPNQDPGPSLGTFVIAVPNNGANLVRVLPYGESALITQQQINYRFP